MRSGAVETPAPRVAEVGSNAPSVTTFSVSETAAS